MIDCEWRVDQVLRSVEKGLPVRPPIRQRQSIAVWRKGDDVRYRVLGDLERRALRLIRSGTQFENVCQSVASRRENRKVPTAMMEMLARWVADGLLVREQKTENVTHRGERVLLSKHWPAVRGNRGRNRGLHKLLQESAGTIRITATDHAVNGVLWPKLPKPSREYPEISESTSQSTVASQTSSFTLWTFLWPGILSLATLSILESHMFAVVEKECARGVKRMDEASIS